jgi:hypothetical protein
VSIAFIIIQPVVIGTWCTLCLVAATAMLLQIPYSLDELVATGQFLVRRRRAGRPVFVVFLFGDTDDGEKQEPGDEFDRAPGRVLRNMVGGGVGLPWNLALCILIGVWLMFTRVTVGAEAGMADTDHLIGMLAITIAIVALAEVARPMRFINVLLGMVLIISPFILGAGWGSIASSLACGVGLIVFSLPRGVVRYHFGEWNRLIV